jgi:hypothetical protein
MLDEGELRHFLKDETVATFRVVYGRLASSSATLAAALRGDACALPVITAIGLHGKLALSVSASCRDGTNWHHPSHLA